MIVEEERFQIVFNTAISMEHYPILYNLYQPIIGANALSLYFSLINEWELLKRINLDVTHLRMIKLLKCSISELEVARNLLEAVGLLDVYVNETQKVKYCYELHLPLSFEKFTNHNLYSEMLSKALGVNDYERTKFVMAKKRCDFSQYNKTTKSFNAVFLEDKAFVKIDHETNIRLNNEIINEEHNWITNEQIYDKKMKQLQDFSPYQYLRILKGFPLQDNDFQLLEKLLYIYELKSEIINCLLDFVYYKNNKLLVISYLEKIATSLKQHNINDIHQAAKYLKTAYEQSKLKEYSISSSYSTNVAKTANNLQANNKYGNNKYVSSWNQGVVPHWLRADLKKKVNS